MCRAPAKMKENLKRALVNVVADMANIDPEEHHFGIDVKLNVPQPGNRMYPHAPRVKVFKASPKINFSISLNPNPTKIRLLRSGDPYKVIRRADLKPLLEKIKKYRIPLLMLWYDQGMTTKEFIKLMKRVDQNESLDNEYQILRTTR